MCEEDTLEVTCRHVSCPTQPPLSCDQEGQVKVTYTTGCCQKDKCGKSAPKRDSTSWYWHYSLPAQHAVYLHISPSVICTFLYSAMSWGLSQFASTRHWNRNFDRGRSNVPPFNCFLHFLVVELCKRRVKTKKDRSKIWCDSKSPADDLEEALVNAGHCTYCNHSGRQRRQTNSYHKHALFSPAEKIQSLQYFISTCDRASRLLFAGVNIPSSFPPSVSLNRVWCEAVL